MADVEYITPQQAFIETVFDPEDAGVQALMDGGCSAVTSVGKWVIMAGNYNRITNDAVTLWTADGKGTSHDALARAIIWIKSGAYDQTYTARVTDTNGVVHEASYTTPKAEYGKVLDTSSVPALVQDPDNATKDNDKDKCEAVTEAVYAGEQDAHGWKHTLFRGDFIYPNATVSWELSSLAYAPTLRIKVGDTYLTNVWPAVPTNAGQYAWEVGSKYVYFHKKTEVGDTSLSIRYWAYKTVTNPQYSYIVNDITRDYNQAVTDYIKDAADKIKPEYIAEMLKNGLVADGVECQVDEMYILLDNVSSATATDGEDDSLVQAVAHSITSVDQLTPRHWAGKVVQIKPTSQSDAFYMKAVAKNDGDAGWTEVQWVEGGAVRNQLQEGGLVFGILSDNKFYIASEHARMVALCGEDMPTFPVSEIGDGDTNPVAYFVGKRIAYLGTFQDRLLIGSGGVVTASVTGDYLNFYHKSVVSSLADDTLQMMPKDEEADEIRYSVDYERNLVFFGQRQYVVFGDSPLTPANAVITTMSSHTGANTVQPIVHGSKMFYAKDGSVGTALYQLQPGQYAETSDSFSVSQPLNTYIPPNAVEICSAAKPDLVLVRSMDSANNLYAFQFIDSQQGREQAAWYRWEYNPALGTLFSAVPADDGVYLLWARDGAVVCDFQELAVTLPDEPYLDSLVQGSGYARPLWAYGQGNLHGIGGTSRSALVTQYGAQPYGGYSFDAYVEFTEPYVRDQNGKAVLRADLVIKAYYVDVYNSSGADISVGGAPLVWEPPYEVGGTALDYTPVVDQTIEVPVMDNTEYSKLRVQAHGWLPLSIVSLQWEGQEYNRTMRG